MLFAAAVVFAAPSARAQLEGFSLERMPRPMSALDGLVVQSPNPVGGVSIQLGAEWIDSPLVLRSTGGDQLDVVRGRLSSFARATLGLGERSQVSVLAPLVAWQDSEGGTIAGLRVPELDSPAFGDIEVAGLFRIFGERRQPALAVTAHLSLPTGSQDELSSDGSIAGGGGLAVNLPLFGDLQWQSSASLAYRPERDYAGTELGTELRTATGLRLPLAPAEVFAEAAQVVPLVGDLEVHAEALVGGRLSFASGLFMQTRLGLGVSDAVGTPTFRAGVSLGWMRALPPYADRDQDGDGIRNRSDLCPREAEDRDGYADADGCPDRDDDNDGVPDADDKCLSEVEDRDGFEDDDGCPDLDDDRDGIADRRDLCPRQPETVNGHRDSDGCPDGIPDSDGDGIVDRDDKCPSQSGESQLGGCPPPRVLRADIAAKLPTAIRFSLGGARLGPDADAPLAALAELLRTTPELEVLAVRGHSSSDGKAAANRKLSEARANAVLNALVMLGIDPARLRAEGLGSTEPAANNATAKGRTSNRRVDFAIHSWKPR